MPIARVLATLALGLLLASPALAQECTTSWAAPSNGSWMEPGNWTNGVPGTSSVACIDAPGNYAVTIPAHSTGFASAVHVGGPSGSQRLLSNGRIELGSGNSLIAENGVLELFRTIPHIQIGLFLSGTLQVEGMVSADGQTTSFLTTGGTVDVAPGGRLVLDNNVRAGSEDALIRIRGILDGQNCNRCEIRGPIEVDGGELNVLSGQMDVRGGGTLRNASLFAAEDAVLQFNVGTGQAGRMIAVEGTLTGDPEGVVEFSGNHLDAGEGTVELAMGGTGFFLRSRILGGGELTATTGSFVNTGIARLGDTAYGTGVRDATLRNEGVLTLVSYTYIWGSGVLENAPEGTVILARIGSAGGNMIEGEGTFINLGRVEHRGVGTESQAHGRLNASFDGRPGSTLAVVSGRLTMGGGGILDGVAFEVDEDAHLQISRSGEDIPWTIEGTLTGEIEGHFDWHIADFLAGSSNPILNLTGEGLNLTGWTLNTTHLGSAGGTFTNVGRIVIGRTGTAFRIGLRGGTLINEGLIELPSTFSFWEDGLLRNEPVGVIRMVNAGFAQQFNDGILENHGLIVRDGTNTNVGFNSTLRSMPGSEVRALTGRVLLDAPGEESIPEGAMLTGTAFFQLRGGLVTGGTISPGTLDDPISSLEFGLSFQLGPTARTIIDIGPDGESDTIVFPTGQPPVIELGGTLVVRVADGFSPAPGDEWSIIQRPGNPIYFPGAFAAIEVEGDIPDGVGFITEQPNEGVMLLRAVAGGASIVASAESTTEGGQPVTFTITSSAPAPPGSALEIPLAFEGTATRFLDYVVDITGSTVRIPAGQTQATITLFPLADDEEEGDEVVTIRLLPGGDIAPGADDAATVIIEDGPLTSGLAVGGIAPSRGGTGGLVSASIFGQGMGPGSTVRLVRGGTVIDGTNVSDNDLGTGLGATFDLRGAASGSYDVVVDHGGASSTLANAFVVEEAAGLSLWADIVGTPNPRQNRWSTYTLTVGNTGNQDLHDTIVLLRVTADVEYEIDGPILIDTEDLPPDPASNSYIGLDVKTASVIPVYIYRVPAGGVSTVPVRIRPTTGAGTGAGVSYELYPPDPQASFTWTGDFDDIDVDTQAGHITNWVAFFGAVGWSFDFLLEDQSRPPRAATEEYERLREGELNNEWNRPHEDLTMTDLVDYYADVTNLGDSPLDALTVAILAASDRGLSAFLHPASSLVGLRYSATTGNPLVIGAAASRLGLSLGLTAMGEKAPGRIVCKFVGQDCGGEGGSGGNGGSTGGAGGGPAGGLGGGAGGKIGFAFDPNDKLGPAGDDSLGFITADQRAYYTIRFENLDTATFPAQEVIIIDDLDTSVYDISSFSLGPITWADQVIVPPAGLQSFSTTVDLAPELPALLLINAGLDPQTARVVWTFATLDPNTNDLPEDGLVGFLPPNVNQPEGEGSVAFTIDILPDLATNTSVDNLAEIYFDLNEPIVTPVWSNRIDRDAPVTSVVPIDPVDEWPVSITVAGSDIGSGILAHLLYVSEDGGPFVHIATSAEPVFEFTGEEDVMYGFYSRAIDFVHNVEPPKDVAEATFSFGVSTEVDSGLPRELTLRPPYPNPSSGAVTLEWGLPSASEPLIVVYDVLGREVRRVVADAPRVAGWYESRAELGLASGIYVVRLSAERDGRMETRTQRLVVVR